ncbi:hypothetical protein HK100_008124 [Physocladia obscura]|uniref:ABC transporter domain-containing protein n=1 Tax=Physocladia obscura TaxID=109957 RepID=A0AAD5T4X3_9FUNG|nr:hypothetical protein HK100_008124 [Physocladia obscura]
METLLSTLQTEAWYLTAAVSSTLANILGAHPYLSTLSTFEYQRGPYAQLVSSTSNNEVDLQLANLLMELISELASLDKSVLYETNPSTTELLAFYANAGKVTRKIPYGAIFLDTFNTNTLEARFILHFGSDKRIESSGIFPTQGERLLTAVAQLGQVSLRGLLSASYSTATITQGIRAFPEVDSTALNLPFGGLIGRILYPFGVSFLLPIFSIILVKEKEDRIFIMMKLNGLKSHYITFYILYILSTAVFLISGAMSRLTFFTQTDPALLILMFFVWGNIQIVLAFMFSSIFNKSRIALVFLIDLLVFLIVLVGVIVSLVSEKLFANTTAPVAFFIWPPFAFYRALSLVNTASFTTTSIPYNLSMIKPGNEVFTILLFMVAEIFVYALITGYLSRVTPSDFGTPLAWHFPVTLPLQLWDKNQRRKLNNGFDPQSEAQLAQTLIIDAAETKFEDSDVRIEKLRVEENEFDTTKCPLILSHMRKVYPSRKGLGPKIAVRDVSFATQIDSVFGLLGPNGAGKTTLISILTGLYPASFGNAFIAGFDIRAEAQEICKVMGICPQFDILWDDLTVEEHLYFYARLKGANSKTDTRLVQKALENVSLTSLRDRLTKRLSGGEKRRLSIAIALIGNPKVVFLDEPTTGLDPEVRRLIWNIIHRAKEGKSIILTTHSMEEAEALCNRIGIMAKGTLRCLANSLRLKDLYGSGFRLYFNANPENMECACKWIESLLPKGYKRTDAFSTMTSYEFPSKENSISTVFAKIEAEKARNGILDWGISQTSLEDVFVRIISEDDANAD